MSSRFALRGGRQRPRAILASVVGTAVAAVTVAVAPTAPAQSAPDPACPAAKPVSALQQGDPVSGLTVSAGTIPDTFTGEYVGRIIDGIAPGLDMLLVKLQGSQITNPVTGEVDRGVWAGMSGSPVYAADGQLIGAVAYGLSFSPSEYAGVTPAQAMYDLGKYDGVSLGGGAAALARTETVEVPERLARRIDVAGSAQQGSLEFERLPMPLGVSGAPPSRLKRAARVLDMPIGSLALTKTSSVWADRPVIEITPGGNLAMAISYGDVTAAGVGTATAVCGPNVLGFGHPMVFGGRSSSTLHGADALFVQKDTVFGSFKVANLAAPSGTITQDRLAGIFGQVGDLPDPHSVTSTMSSTAGNSRVGETIVNEPEWVPDLATFHALANLDRVFDAFAAGTGTLGWRAIVERPDGSRLRYQRSETYADEFDLTISMIWDLWSELYAISSNRFTKVRLIDIDQSARLDDTFRRYRLGRVQVLKSGVWVTVRRDTVHRVRPGSVLRVRVSLDPGRTDAVARGAVFELRVPNASAGRRGSLELLGGENIWVNPGAGKSLQDMLRRMAAVPPNDAVVAKLRVGSSTGRITNQQTKVWEANKAPVRGSFSIGLRVTR